MKITKLDLFEDIASSMDFWVDAASEALTNADSDLTWVEEQEPYQKLRGLLIDAEVNPEDIEKILKECLRGFAVSILTAIDGGTALAEKGRVHLVDSDGVGLGEGLHEEFVGYLLDSGRIQ